MSSTIRQGDVLSLLGTLGFDCDTVRENARICQYPSSDLVILLTERPADELLREQTLFGVKLQLENYGLMSREEFDRWAARKARANARNGANGSRPTPKTRTDASPPN